MVTNPTCQEELNSGLQKTTSPEVAGQYVLDRKEFVSSRGRKIGIT